MKMNIKTTIGIIAIALSSISMAEAGQKNHQRDTDRLNDRAHSRNYEKPRHERQFRKYENRKQSRQAYRHREVYRELRHKRKFNRSMRRINRAHRGHPGLNRGWRSERRHFNRDRHSAYRASGYYSAPAYSSRVVVSGNGHSGNVLPVLAGGIIGSAIASDASNGDPGAALGGALFGAIVGNAIAQH